jgi:hypothetical protein
MFGFKLWRGIFKAKPNMRFAGFAWDACVFAIKVCCSKAMPNTWFACGVLACLPQKCGGVLKNFGNWYDFA